MRQPGRATIYASAFLLLVASVLPGVAALGQNDDKMVIPAGDSLSKYYSFLFPSFENATVKMRDGRSVIYKMNFNLLLCDMQFIDAQGDTLEVTNPEDIYSIRLDSCSFIYDDKRGYYQILAAAGAASLVVVRQAKFEYASGSGLAAAPPGGGVELYNKGETRQAMVPLVLQKDIYAWRNTSYLVFNESGKVENADRAAFLKIFAGDKKSFETFVKANKIDYKKQNDLEKLFHFCTR